MLDPLKGLGPCFPALMYPSVPVLLPVRQADGLKEGAYRGDDGVVDDNGAVCEPHVQLFLAV